MSEFWKKRALTDKELVDILENEDIEYFTPPIDNKEDTDIESDYDEEQVISSTIENESAVPLLEDPITTLPIAPESINLIHELEPPVEQEPERKWQKIEKQTVLPAYDPGNGAWEDIHFIDCKTPTDIFIKLLGNALDDITFQSNLYATQKGKKLNLSKEELLAFIGINFLMGYHVLPSISDYWSNREDTKVSFVPETMSRNRFQDILSNLHLNDNSILSKTNDDKLFKLRPLLDTLNSQFMNYSGARKMCVDESIIKFKGRSSLKQYNPMKPVKRGFKVWCLSDMSGFVKKFDVYQGKNEAIGKKLENFTLGERVVLHMTEQEWGMNKIIYFDNFFTTVRLLEKLVAEKTLACGTIRNNRKGIPKNLTPDNKLQRGEFDHRTSNTNLTIFKWKDNKPVTIISNFHGTEKVEVKRKLRDGTITKISAPVIIKDYNESMGGVDFHDQLRQYYGIDRRSKKWWHRLFWGCIEISFINAFVLFKKIFNEEKADLLTFRRDVTLGLCVLSPKQGQKRRTSSGTPNTKKRRYNYSVPDAIRLSSRGNHWPKFPGRRGRCEMCSAQGIQSKPHSTCSLCGVFLCINEKKNCFVKYHDIQLE